MEFVIITGVSGAGKSHAIKYFEDMDYYCMDNLPPTLLTNFVELCFSSNMSIDKVGVVVDIRGGAFFDDIFKGLEQLKDKGVNYKILFLDAEDKKLIQRFKEHRRPHPMSTEGMITVGINKEREVLKNVKEKADYVIDTTYLNLGALKEEIYSIFGDQESQKNLAISVVSFGFKNGILLDADLVFDVRFLPNPYYIDSLRPLSGKDKAIQDYIFKFDETQFFLDKYVELLEYLIPLYIKEGKSQLVIGIGCTGGRHRSVAITEELKSILSKKGHTAWANHRDINRKGL